MKYQSIMQFCRTELGKGHGSQIIITTIPSAFFTAKVNNKTAEALATYFAFTIDSCQVRREQNTIKFPVWWLRKHVKAELPIFPLWEEPECNHCSDCDCDCHDDHEAPTFRCWEELTPDEQAFLQLAEHRAERHGDTFPFSWWEDLAKEVNFDGDLERLLEPLYDEPIGCRDESRYWPASGESYDSIAGIRESELE